MTAFPQHPARSAQQSAAFFRVLLTLLAMIAIAVRPAAAQSILRDAETEALFQDMMDPLLVAAGLQPGQVRVHLLGDPSINAFVGRIAEQGRERAALHAAEAVQHGE